MHIHAADIGERDFGLKMTLRTNMRSVGVNQRDVDRWIERIVTYGYEHAYISINANESLCYYKIRILWDLLCGVSGVEGDIDG